MLGADLAEQITALKAEPGKDLLAHGGASFARSVIRLGLIDEYRLLVHPLVLGSGLAPPRFPPLMSPVWPNGGHKSGTSVPAFLGHSSLPGVAVMARSWWA